MRRRRFSIDSSRPMSFPKSKGVSTFRLLSPALGALLMWSAAFAQHAADNVVTAAEDAFGTSLGYSAIGLYTPYDARGFSPAQAGNLRIEGLYFDDQNYGFDSCLVRSSSMRIGIAAQSYSFPSPSGIADLNLNIPGEAWQASAIAYRGPFDGAGGYLEVQAPVLSKLAIDVCAAYTNDATPDVLRSSHQLSVGSVWRWQPTEGTEVIPFVNYVPGGGVRITPAVYTDAVEPPPLFSEFRLATQNFTTWDWYHDTAGILLRQAVSPWALAAGLFWSHDRAPTYFTEEYLSILPNRTVDHVLDISPTLTAGSTSGEVRLSRFFARGKHRAKVELSVRGRNSQRSYGGDALIDYGIVSLDSGPPPPLTSFVTGAESLDRTRQLDLGAVFEDRVADLGSFGLGILKDQYRRTIDTPGSPSQTSSVEPWLLNTRATFQAHRTATLYASYIQGLEDSALAPSTAVNRGEPPPATRTHQTDAGVRYQPWPTLTLIAGLFDIHKTYFNSDAANVYTALGTIDHRGFETSLTYHDHGLTLVAGAVGLRPRVSRAIPEPGATGSIPLGPVPLEFKFNADYQVHGPWSINGQWNYFSPRVVTADDRYYLPALSTFGAGLRYSSDLLGHPWSLRLDGWNLTNAQGLHVSSVWYLSPELQRRVQLTFSIDT
jgi:iron complex outermembrane recepter protein